MTISYSGDSIAIKRCKNVVDYVREWIEGSGYPVAISGNLDGVLEKRLEVISTSCIFAFPQIAKDGNIISFFAFDQGSTTIDGKIYYRGFLKASESKRESIIGLSEQCLAYGVDYATAVCLHELAHIDEMLRYNKTPVDMVKSCARLTRKFNTMHNKDIVACECNS